MNRSIGRILRAPFRATHYHSLLGSKVYAHWRESFLSRYVMGRGLYPAKCHLHSPIGDICLTLYSHDDSFTVQEIFGLQCYRASTETVIADFGSNIGVSAAYFLSRNPSAFVYCFEPLPVNADRLCENLHGFRERFLLTRSAITDQDGSVAFRVEPTGRYSGIDNKHGTLQTFPSVSANRVLEDIISKHGRIDILKIDVEGAERIFFPTLQAEVLSRIGTIYIEGGDRFQPAGFQVDHVHGADRYRAING
jgi:FkbM family methyltransferase